MTRDEKILRERVRACRDWYQLAQASGSTQEQVKAAIAVDAAEKTLTEHKQGLRNEYSRQA